MGGKTRKAVADWKDYFDGDGVHAADRHAQGGTLNLILETDACTMLTTECIMLHAWICTAGFDNVQYTAMDPTITTYAYSDVNAMTTATEDGVTTTYVYDNWGRNISKSKPKPGGGNALWLRGWFCAAPTGLIHWCCGNPGLRFACPALILSRPVGAEGRCVGVGGVC